jgi:hypothetical protein
MTSYILAYRDARLGGTIATTLRVGNVLFRNAGKNRPSYTVPCARAHETRGSAFSTLWWADREGMCNCMWAGDLRERASGRHVVTPKL